jgi:hypothetical protein
MLTFKRGWYTWLSPQGETLLPLFDLSLVPLDYLEEEDTPTYH